jgi:NACalpha-BTF3-like transcription factor
MGHSETFVIMGHAQISDISKGFQQGGAGRTRQQNDQLTEQLRQLTSQLKNQTSTEENDDLPPPLEETKPTTTTTETKTESKPVEKKTESAPVDATGVEEKDIELVRAQCSEATREQIIAALKANNMDVVNTIMELSGV